MPSNFENYLQAIRTAVYGKDVRAAIANGLVEAYNHGGSGGGGEGGGSSQDLSAYLTKSEASSTYVAKDGSKGLSTNDFTNALKTKLEGIDLSGYSDLITSVSSNTEDIAELRQLIDDYHYSPITVSSLSINSYYMDQTQTTGAFTEIKTQVDKVVLAYTLSRNAKSLTVTMGSSTTPIFEANSTTNADKLVGGSQILLELTNNGTGWTRSTYGSYKFNVNVVDDRDASATKAVSFYFTNYVYYGAAVMPDTINANFIRNLSNNELTTTKARTINVTAETNEYIWYAVPARLVSSVDCVFAAMPAGIPGGFSVFTPVVVEAVPNNYTFTENYKLYRSDNHSLGASQIKIT